MLWGGDDIHQPLGEGVASKLMAALIPVTVDGKVKGRAVPGPENRQQIEIRRLPGVQDFSQHTIGLV